MKSARTCARCGRSFEATVSRGEAESAYCSFRCEVLALLGGLGPGLVWLLIALVWGLAAFALVLLIARAVIGGVDRNPVAYFGLAAVLAVALALLTPWFRRRR